MSPVRRKPPKEVACRRVPNGHSRLNGAAAALFRSVGKLRPVAPEIGVGGRFENGSHAIRCPALGRTRRNGKAQSSSAPPRVRSQWCRRQIAERRAHCTEGAHGTGRAQPHGSLAGASGKDGRTVRPSGAIYAGPSKDPGPAARVPTGDMVVRRHGCQWSASRQRRIGPRSTRRPPGRMRPGHEFGAQRHFLPARDGGTGIGSARGDGRVRRGRRDHEGTGNGRDAVVRGRRGWPGQTAAGFCERFSGPRGCGPQARVEAGDGPVRWPGAERGDGARHGPCGVVKG